MAFKASHLGGLLMLVTSILVLAAGSCRFTAPASVHALDLSVIVLASILLLLMWALSMFNAAIKRPMGSLLYLVTLPYTLLAILFLVLCSIDYCMSANDALSISLIVFGCIGIIIMLISTAVRSVAVDAIKAPLGFIRGI